jgi:hypothetical protein
MRTSDRALPTVTLDTGLASIAHWPMRPVIAIGTIQKPPYGWDYLADWDDPNIEWDVPLSPAHLDATCEWTGLEITYGPPDDHTAFPAAHLIVQLNNSTGQWSQYNVDGSPALSGPGQTIDVWAHSDTGPADYWLFSGTIARWDERADDTVEIEAFDAFSTLAQQVGTYTPGTNGDKLATRLTAILTAAGRASLPKRFATGLVTLTAQATDRAPLEEMQIVASSDGGVLFGDADGTLVAYDRNWRNGRSDQPALPVISDNVCTSPIIIWDPVISTNDTNLGDTIVLENVAKLRAQAPATITGFVLTETEQQWTSQGEGDTLASALLTAQRQPRVALDSFDLYLLDARQPTLWQAVDWRLFDAVRFLHDSKAVGGTARLDVTTLVTAITHSVTPDGWVMTVATSRALSYIAPINWDSPPYVWNDASPLAVWNY